MIFRLIQMIECKENTNIISDKKFRLFLSVQGPIHSKHQKYISQFILYFLISISYMSCCTDKKLEKENGIIKGDKRKLQTQLDTIRSQKQQLQLIRDSLNEQKENLQMKLKEKDETITKNEEKVIIFKQNFHIEIQQNDKKGKENINKMQQCDLLSQIELKQIELTYKSIELFFDHHYDAGRSQQINMLLSGLFNLLNGQCYNAKKLILSVRRYTKLIKQVITQGYIGKEDQQLTLAHKFLQENFSEFSKELEELIKLSKEKYSKDRSKILEESGIDSNNDVEIKLQNKVTELEQIIENLKAEKEKAQQENQRFQTITIPRLREELQKKQAGFDEIKGTLHKIENKFIDKDQLLSELEEMKGFIRSIIYSNSNQQTVEIIKAKDLQITQLKRKIAQNEAKKLSEWTQQTELSNRKAQVEIHSKNKEIQNLKRSLNEQKEAFQEISSQMIDKQKLLSDSFVIQEKMSSKQKQNLQLSSELQKANEKVSILKKQLTLVQQNASKQAAQINSQLAAKQRQLTESKTRTKLLLDDNTTQKEKRAILSAQFTEKEREIQTFKEELGSLSSQNQTLRVQIQQILSLNRSLERQNQQITQQLENSQKIGKSNSLIQEQLPRRQNIQQQKSILSLQNQFRKEKQQLEKAIDDLQKVNNSITTDMLRKTKKLSAELQEKTFTISSLQLNFNNLEVLKFDLQNQIKTLSKELKELKTQVKEKQSLQKFRRNAIEKIQTLEQLLQKEKKNVTLLQSEVKSLKQLNIKMGEKLHELSSSNQSSRMRSASFVEHRTLFIGDILEKRKVEKKFLMSSIETVMKQQIQKTVKIYEYKRDKSINPHTFIDGHSNIVVIVQTEKALIAAYYSGELQSKSPMTSQALILSLDNRKFYQLKENQNNPADNRVPKGMVYDQYFIIFGNTQIRIRSGEAKIFSNFGTQSGFFNSRGDKINSLFRDGTNNEVDLINYEIHQIIFNESYSYQSV